jgi:PAS domain S-box-containing protein
LPEPRFPSRTWHAYAFAALVTAAVVGAQLFLTRWLGDSLLPLTIAVLAAAWYAGGRAGLLATALGGVLAFTYVLVPRHGLWLDAPQDRAALAAFVVLGVLVSAVSEAFHVARRRLEAERARLRESDAFHGAIADLSTDFAFSARVEADGTIVPEAVTDGFSALLGFTLRELPARGGWAALLHPDDRERARLQVQQLLRGHTIDGEARHLTRDGRVLQLQYRVRPLWNERGRVVHVYGAYRDVTRERQAQQQVREREQQLQLLADNAPVLIAHCDGEQRFRFVNKPYAQRLGLRRSEIVGRTIRDVVGEEAYATLAPHVEAALAGERVEFEAELPYRGRELEPVRVAYEPERDGEGRVVGFVAAIVSTAEQRRAQEDLRKSEERLRLALEGARQGTWDWDLAGGRVSWDERCAVVFGWRRAAVVTWEDHVGVAHPDDRESLAQAAEAALREHARLDHEHRIVARDGSVRWVQVRGRGSYDAAGAPFRMSGTVVDVTERKRLEHALRDSEARFRQLAEAIPHIAFTATPEGNVEYVNSQWHTFSGRPEDESFGLGWLQVLHPEDYAAAYRGWIHSLRSGEPFEAEYRFRGADGSFRWHLCRALPVRDEAGRIARWVGTSTDVHEQRQLTDQLATERGLLDAVFASSPIGIAVLDREGRFLRVNEVLSAIDGVAVADHAGRPARDAAPGLWGALESLYRQVLASAQPVTNYGVSRQTPGGGAVRHWLANGYPIGTRDGIAGVGIAVVDITEQKRTQEALERSEEALRAADRRKDEFLATLAHELRNPLNPIRSAVQVLRTRGVKEPEQDWSRDVIDRQVDHLTRLIDDLLDISRISRGKLELRREPVELGEVLRGALEANRPLVEQLGHNVSIELPQEPLYLDGDLVRLTQVFLNLLNNAAKYTERGGRIWLTARREGGQVVVSVRDSGVGIAPEKLPHLFEMFYQVDRSLERAQGGLGIGLSLVKQLVSMHGGRVAVRSEGVGKGSEFRVELPLTAAPAAIARPAAPAAAGRPRKRRVLVVDDNADSASSLALVLQLAGHDVDTASDGEEALWKAEQTKPEVVLLDIGMPKLNGYEVCRRIRSQPWGRQMLLVAQTGWGQQEDRRRTHEAGFDAHLVKPIDPPSLERLMQLDVGEHSVEVDESPRVH